MQTFNMFEENTTSGLFLTIATALQKSRIPLK